MNRTETRTMTGNLLAGKTAVISGAGRIQGIGRATARLFIEHGARVALLDVNEEEVKEAAHDVAHGEPVALGVRCDVTSMESCLAAIGQVQKWSASGGRIDVLINNAGVTQKISAADITLQDHLRITDVVLRGTMQLSQAAIPTMRSQKAGSIIAISSMSAQQGGGVFGGAHYCAAKAGVLGYTRALARELGPDGIRANAITPGLIVTDFSRTSTPEDVLHSAAGSWPLGRAGSASEIAGACLFLASDLSSYVTGSTLDVNGGAYMR
ncbi:SDR family NAD(P)-dependent oxidoreductase [Cupriavidus basilensis]|uniref:SDR family NAD(P)-dependent oxidoreductase n=1 Tax=Cupriavidus basilensis TaxID=68895 RepID=UPI0020A62E6D|nr:SDR family NAD(P)-dependent oxidoreductase [Cupriavidus basilensis]MCP3018221.1 SDR family oxidoreductase [Cupriavidus basilensis]